MCIVSGLKVKPLLPTSTDWIVLEAEPLVVELAGVVVVVIVVLLEPPPPPYWASTRGSHKRANVHMHALIIITTG